MIDLKSWWFWGAFYFTILTFLAFYQDAHLVGWMLCGAAIGILIRVATEGGDA